MVVSQAVVKICPGRELEVRSGSLLTDTGYRLLEYPVLGVAVEGNSPPSPAD